MKKLFTAVLLLLLGSSVYSQTINYQSNFHYALLDAKKHNKPVFLLLAVTPIPPPGATKMTFRSGIDDPEVAKLYNKSFINVKINIADSAFAVFRKEYSLQLNTFPAYLFFDADGYLLYKGESFNSISPEKYLNMAHQASNAASSGKTIGTYEKLHKQGKLDAASLKEYIALKESLGLHDNADLIDEYVNSLTIKSFNDYKEVLFILKAGPLAYGKAYNLCYTNRKIVDSIYKTEPIETRREINNNIILNTRAKAIKNKDRSLAIQLSNYIRGTWSKNYVQANKAATEELIYYYSTVKDTTNYYQQASFYYDYYYVNISADSAKRLTDKTLENIKQANMSRMKKINEEMNKQQSSLTAADSSKKHIVTRTYTMETGTPVNNVALTLNNAAYRFYELGTRNPLNLTKAMLWSQRSIALSPDNYAYYDTLAHILYRLGLYEEAQVKQKKAIELFKPSPMASNNIPSLKKELSKMQEHTL